MATPTAIAAYLLLFVGAGFIFLFANLLLGKFCRPKAPNSEKTEVYECGEPTIGSSFVQFDLRFYVVALLFIIFDVEVAFFFPWGAVFGKSTQLMDPNMKVVEQGSGVRGRGLEIQLTPAAVGLYRELGVKNPTVPQAAAPAVAASAKGKAAAAAPASGNSSLEQADSAIRSDAAALARLSMIDIGAFFAVLLVGFAYVWRRGDLDWVRAVSRERSTGIEPSEPPASIEQQPVISA